MKLSDLLQLASIAVIGMICFVFIFRMVQYQGKIIEGATGSGKQECDDNNYSSKLKLATAGLDAKYKVCKEEEEKILGDMINNIDKRIHILTMHHKYNPLADSDEKDTNEPCNSKIVDYMDKLQKLVWLRNHIDIYQPPQTDDN